eukprot:123271-Pelagomonas_calceolata.AAC.1
MAGSAHRSITVKDRSRRQASCNGAGCSQCEGSMWCAYQGCTGSSWLVVAPTPITLYQLVVLCCSAAVPLLLLMTSAIDGTEHQVDECHGCCQFSVPPMEPPMELVMVSIQLQRQICTHT